MFIDFYNTFAAIFSHVRYWILRFYRQRSQTHGVKGGNLKNEIQHYTLRNN